MNPNVRYNRLELETADERDVRRKAEAEEKRIRRKQMILRRGDVPTPSPPSFEENAEQSEQLPPPLELQPCSRCGISRLLNELRTCQNCRATRNTVRSCRELDFSSPSPHRTPVQTLSPPFSTPSSTPSLNFLYNTAVSEEHWEYIRNFYDSLNQLKREECVRCNEKWFDMKLFEGVCDRCVRVHQSNKPYLFTPENNADVGFVPEHLPQLTDFEEMLIARVHVHLQVWQVKGQQYKYKSHIVNFMQNTPKVYDKLPLLPAELNVSRSEPFEAHVNFFRFCF